MNKRNVSEKAFTIIEVVLVLAIAALIFLMVFLALPALQKSQRDNARKQDAARISSAITNFTSTYRAPFTCEDKSGNTTDRLMKFIDKLDQYRANGDTSFIDCNKGADTAEPALDKVAIRTGTKCNGPDADASGATDRTSTVRVKLEGGTTYCVDAS